MKKTKLFAAYLPQYHETKENDEFWGYGFTDWVGVKQAKPQFKGHSQPKVPLNGNYYDLSNWEVIKWQAELARKYGIDGFNIYHYWFKDAHQVLQLPAENLLKHREINIMYFFSWDNCSWVRSWSDISGNEWAPEKDKKIVGGKKCLLELDYGDQAQWEKHFYYLLPFFSDKRYLKVEGKPVFAFMTSVDQQKLLEMGNYWKDLAKKNGFPGLYLISRKDEFRNKHLFDNQFLYQPPACSWGKRMSIEGRLKKYFKINPKKDGAVKYYYDYEKAWKNLLKHANKQVKQGLILGAMVSFDDTPRRGADARILSSSNPTIFYKYFSKLYKLCCKNNQELLLITAWNEWGEGAYLEPDTENKFAYLEAIKKAVNNILIDNIDD